MRSQTTNDNQDFEKKVHRSTDKLLTLLQQHHDYSVPYQVVRKQIIEIEAVEAEALPVDVCVLPIPEPNLTVEGIKRVVCRHYGVTHADMISARRDRKIGVPRMIAIYLARKLTLNSFPDIARRFGGRDHSTVIHSFRKIESLIDKGDPIASHVENLVGILTA